MALTNAEKQARWRAAHPEAKRKANREYWAKNGARYNAAKRERYAKAKEKDGK